VRLVVEAALGNQAKRDIYLQLRICSENYRRVTRELITGSGLPDVSEYVSHIMALYDLLSSYVLARAGSEKFAYLAALESLESYRVNPSALQARMVIQHPKNEMWGTAKIKAERRKRLHDVLGEFEAARQALERLAYDLNIMDFQGDINVTEAKKQ
jgi:hypothetical protein